LTKFLENSLTKGKTHDYNITNKSSVNGRGFEKTDARLIVQEEPFAPIFVSASWNAVRLAYELPCAGMIRSANGEAVRLI
jgi:hypothetical protein